MPTSTNTDTVCFAGIQEGIQRETGYQTHDDGYRVNDRTDDPVGKTEDEGLRFPCSKYRKLSHKNFFSKVPKVPGETSAKFLADDICYVSNGAQSTRQIYQFPKREACLMAIRYLLKKTPGFREKIIAVNFYASTKTALAGPFAYLAGYSPGMDNRLFSLHFITLGWGNLLFLLQVLTLVLINCPALSRSTLRLLDN